VIRWVHPKIPPGGIDLDAGGALRYDYRYPVEPREEMGTQSR
jgi:hypothetical protein